MNYIVKWKNIIFVSVTLSGVSVLATITPMIDGAILSSSSLLVCLMSVGIMNLAFLFWVFFAKPFSFVKTVNINYDNSVLVSEVLEEFSLGELAEVLGEIPRENQLIAAVLLTLAMKKFIKINFNIEKQSRLELLAQNKERCSFLILQTNFEDADLTEEEIIVFKVLLERSDENDIVNGHKLYTKLVGALRRVRAVTKKRLKQKKYLSGWNILLKFIYLLAIPVSIFFIFSIEKSFEVIFLQDILVTGVLIVFIFLMKHKTSEGLKIRKKILHFQEQLLPAFSDKLDVNNFKMLLPIVMVLGPNTSAQMVDACSGCYQPVEWFMINNKRVANAEELIRAIYLFSDVCVAEFIGNSVYVD